MVKKIGAVSIGVIIGLVVAFARAGAFQLWGSDKPAMPIQPHAIRAGGASQTAGSSFAGPGQSARAQREGGRHHVFCAVGEARDADRG